MRFILLSLMFVGCGGKPKSSGDATEPQDSATATAADDEAALLIESLPFAFESKETLPACAEAGKGRVAYVKADAVLVVCDGAGEWTHSKLDGTACAETDVPEPQPTASPEPTKIKKGITKVQVQAILGDPVSVSGIKWAYDGTDKCAPGEPYCAVYFSSDGKLNDTYEINPAFVDLTAP